MNISNILDLNRICVSDEQLNKKRVLAKLSELIATASDELESNLLLQQFIARERLGSTAIGHGVALPHIRQSIVTQPIGAILLLKQQPVSFDRLDDESIDIFFALVVPEEAHEQHLNLLSEIARLFQQEQTRTAIRQARQAEQIYQLLCPKEVKTSEHNR